MKRLMDLKSNNNVNSRNRGFLGYLKRVVISLLVCLLVMPTNIKANESYIPLEVREIKNTVDNLLYDQYQNMINNSKKTIIRYLERYYKVSGNVSDITKKGNSLVYENDEVNIVANFTSYDQLVDDVSGYIFAVNKMLSFCDNIGLKNFDRVEGTILEKAIKEYGYSFNFDEVDISGYLKGSSDKKSFYYYDLYTALSDCLINETRGYYINEWLDYDVEYITYQTYYDEENDEEVYVEFVEELSLEDKELVSELELKQEETIKYYHNIEGKLYVPIYYDLSSYNKYRIDSLLENFSGNDYYNVSYLLSRIVEYYYQQYLLYYCGKESSLNQQEVMYPIVSEWLQLAYYPSGMNTPFSLAKGSGVTSEVESNITGESYDIWQEIERLRENGTLSLRSYSYQCTSFASYWFYQIYGFDPLRGDGNQMAKALVRDYPNMFELSVTPKAGAIYSIGSPYEANHVGCVDAVDFENGTITISEGNLTFGQWWLSGTENTIIRYKYQMTFDEFNKYVKNICKDMADTTYGGWVIFANPIN